MSSFPFPFLLLLSLFLALSLSSSPFPFPYSLPYVSSADSSSSSSITNPGEITGVSYYQLFSLSSPPPPSPSPSAPSPSPPSSFLSDLKKSYRSLALQYHPDKISSSPTPLNPYYSLSSSLLSDKDFFLWIQQAYEVLTDEKKRAEYDYLLSKKIMDYSHSDYLYHYYRQRIQNEYEENPLITVLAAAFIIAITAYFPVVVFMKKWKIRKQKERAKKNELDNINKERMLRVKKDNEWKERKEKEMREGVERKKRAEEWRENEGDDDDNDNGDDVELTEEEIAERKRVKDEKVKLKKFRQIAKKLLSSLPFNVEEKPNYIEMNPGNPSNDNESEINPSHDADHDDESNSEILIKHSDITQIEEIIQKIEEYNTKINEGNHENNDEKKGNESESGNVRNRKSKKSKKKKRQQNETNGEEHEGVEEKEDKEKENESTEDDIDNNHYTSDLLSSHLHSYLYHISHAIRQSLRARESQLREEMEKERLVRQRQQEGNHEGGKEGKTIEKDNDSVEWSAEELIALGKAVLKYPRGVPARWQRIQQFLTVQCGETTKNERQITGKVREVEVIMTMPKKSDFEEFVKQLKDKEKGKGKRENEEEITRSENSYLNAGSATSSSSIPSIADLPLPPLSSSSSSSSSSPLPSSSSPSLWHQRDQVLFEKALQSVPRSLSPKSRFLQVSALVPGKTADECKERFQQIRDQVLKERKKEKEKEKEKEKKIEK